MSKIKEIPVAEPEWSHVETVDPELREPMELEGEELGCWRLEECLGAGGLSEVYKASHIHLGVQAAIKLTHFEYLDRDDIIARFQREARVLMECKHPNIIEAKEFSVDEHYGPYLVLELLRGYPLSVLLDENQGRLNLEWLSQLTSQLCHALAAIHKQGLIHRDIKPSNVFLVPKEEGVPHLKLLDFGTAKTRLIQADEELTTTGLIIGTPHYMAPEQIREAANVSPAADIYSLGALIYEMLTGELPHRASSAFQQLVCVLQEEPTPIGNLRPDLAGTELEALVEKMLEKDPAARPNSILAVKRALEKAVASLEQSAVQDERKARTPDLRSMAFAMTTPLPATTRFVLQQTKVLSAKKLAPGDHGWKQEAAVDSPETTRNITPSPTPQRSTLSTPPSPPSPSSPSMESELDFLPTRNLVKPLLLGLLVVVAVGLYMLPWAHLLPSVEGTSAAKKPGEPPTKRSFFGTMKLQLPEDTKKAAVPPRRKPARPKPARRRPSKSTKRPRRRALRKAPSTLSRARAALKRRKWRLSLQFYERYVKRYPQKLKDPRIKRAMRRCRCKLKIPLAWESCTP